MTREPASRANSTTERPIGPAPDDQHGLIGAGDRAVHGVEADPERLHERQLFVAQLCGSVQLARGDSEQRSQAAVDVDAKCLVILAAVGVAAHE